MQKVLESSARGLIRKEGTAGPQKTRISAPVIRGPGASVCKTPTDSTYSRGNPLVEGGSEVGDRRKDKRDLTLRDRPLDTQKGALGRKRSASGKSGGITGYRGQIPE